MLKMQVMNQAPNVGVEAIATTFRIERICANDAPRRIWKLMHLAPIPTPAWCWGLMAKFL